MPKGQTILELFDSCYTADSRSGCWIWKRALKGKEVARGGGYGCLRLKGKLLGAHRFSYEKAKGKIPPGMHVMHLCHNTKCVNPDHLTLGTNLENQRHSARDLRKANKLTPEAVRDIKKSCAQGVTQKEMATKYKIAQGDVSHILAGHWWAHVS